MLVAALRGLEGNMGNALDFTFFVNHRVHRRHLTVHFLAEFRLAEIKTAREFTHAEDVEAALDDRVLDR